MAGLLCNVFSWLHTTATSYDYESIDPPFIENFNLNKTRKSNSSPIKPLPTLDWGSAQLLQKTTKWQSPVLKQVTQHQSPILQTIRKHPSWELFTKTATHQIIPKASSSNLDSLPNELKLAIMQRLPSIDAFLELSLTSKSLHKIRTQHNPVILPYVLQNELGQPLFEEAYFVTRAAHAGFTHGDYAQQIIDFLEEWVDCEPSSVQPISLPFQTILDMSKLHHRVKLLVADFCSWAMEDFVGLRCGSDSVVQLSPSETLRVTRAFYRLELFCILYRARSMTPDGAFEEGNRVRSQHRGMRFRAYQLFDNWNAWENEEIACVRDYIYDRLAKFFGHIQRITTAKPIKVTIYQEGHEQPQMPDPADLPPDALAFWYGDAPSWYDSKFDCGVDLSPEGYLDQLQELFLSQGIECLSRLFSETNDQKRVAMFLSKWHVFKHNSDGSGFFSEQLTATPCRMRMESETREAYFHGDEEIFESDEAAEGPNFAWTWTGGQKFQPFYAAPDRAYLRRWGYVIWDRKRLMDSSACQDSFYALSDTWGQCYPSLIKAHKKTCWRRSKEANQEDEIDVYSHATTEEDETSTAEYDDDSQSEEGGVINEDLDEHEEANTHEDEEHLVDVRDVSPERGHLSIDADQSCSDALDSSTPPRNDTQELGKELRCCLSAPDTWSEEAVDATSGNDDSSLSLSNEAITSMDYHAGTYCESKDQREYTGSNQVDSIELQPATTTPGSADGIKVVNGTIFGTFVGDFHTASVLEPAYCTAISKGTAQFLLFPGDNMQPEAASRDFTFTVTGFQTVHRAAEQNSAAIDKAISSSVNDPDRGDTVTEAVPAVDHIAKVPRERKIARAVSPKSKMLKTQQDLTGVISDPKMATPVAEIMYTTSGSAVNHPRAPSPPTSDYSSFSSDSHALIESQVSATTSNGLPSPPVSAAHLVTSRPRRLIKNGRKPKHRGIKASAPPNEIDDELDNNANADVEPTEDITRCYLSTKAPEDVVAWIEQPGSCHPLPTQRSNSPSSNESGGSNTDGIPTKQQRKKANRKARKVAMETAIQQAQEMEADRLRKEKARKEHQKIKKERKRVEFLKGKGNANPKKANPEGEKGKGGKERKKGYLIG